MMTEMSSVSVVPGNGWYVAAVPVAVATVVAVVGLIACFMRTLDQGEQFIGPGRHTTTLTTPGTYVIWSDYRTVFAGRC